jgi:hypothetical protein
MCYPLFQAEWDRYDQRNHQTYNYLEALSAHVIVNPTTIRSRRFRQRGTVNKKNFISSNISAAPVYDVYISQLIRYWRVCGYYATYKVFFINRPSLSEPSWSYGSWIYNYMCTQCLSPLKLWVPTPFMAKWSFNLAFRYIEDVLSLNNCMFGDFVDRIYPIQLEIKDNKYTDRSHYVIKFVSDLRQVGGFFRVLRFPPPIKLTATI